MEKRDAKRFENSQIPENKIEEIIATVYRTAYKEAYRAIKHDSSIELSNSDFLPSFLETNHKINGDVEDYGLSLFDTEENIKNFVNSINGLRKRVKYIAKGKVDFKKGIADRHKSNGHFQFYLFDPIKKNPVSDFKYHAKYEYKIGGNKK